MEALGLAIGAQPHGGTGVVPGTQTIPHLNGGRPRFGAEELTLAIGTQLHGGTNSVSPLQTLSH